MTAADPTATEFLDPKQIAGALRVAYPTVLGWIRGGELAAIALGAGGRGPYRITPDALGRFLEARTRRPAADPGGEPEAVMTAPDPAGPRSVAPRGRGRARRAGSGLVAP